MLRYLLSITRIWIQKALISSKFLSTTIRGNLQYSGLIFIYLELLKLYRLIASNVKKNKNKTPITALLILPLLQIDEEGNIKEKEGLEYFKTQFGKEEWFFNLVEKAYPKCYQQSRNITKFVKDKEDPLSCSPAAMKMHHCMWREIQLTCPDEKITDPKTCGKIREKIKKHEDIGFRHVHHVHDDD